MYFVLYLINIIIWAFVGAYFAKIIHLAYKQRTKRFIKIRMQKAAMLSVLVGFLSSVSNGAHNVSSIVTNIFIVMLAMVVYSVPKYRLVYKTKRMIAKQDKRFATKYPELYLRLHRN